MREKKKGKEKQQNKEYEPEILDFTVRKIAADYMRDSMP